jgi:hypothetical protein
MSIKKDIPVYVVSIDGDDFFGMTALSAVGVPAHELMFKTFSKQKEEKKYFFSDEKMTVYGVAIAAEVMIPRVTKEHGVHYLVFDSDVSRKIALKTLKSGSYKNFNLEHNEKTISDVYNVMALIVDSSIGVEAPSMFADQNLKDGSFILGYKTDNPETWAKIKEKNGFSIEGYFDQELIGKSKREFSKQNNINKKDKKMASLFDQIFGSKKETKKYEFNAQTADGNEIVFDGELAIGIQIFIMNEAGEQVPAPAGEYVIKVDSEDFNTIVIVDEAGMVTEIKPVEAEVADEAPADEVAEMKADFSATVKELTVQLGKVVEDIKKDYEAKFSAQELKIAELQKAVNGKGVTQKFAKQVEVKAAEKSEDKNVPLWKKK